MHHDGRECREQFNQIIAVCNGIHTVCSCCGKVKELCGVLTVQRIGGACKCTGTERTVVHAVEDVSKTGIVAAEHLKVSTEVVCQRKRLRLLQVREARHVGVDVFLDDTLQGSEQFEYECTKFSNLITHIQLHVQCNLVVTTASGMKLFAGLADAADQGCLHEAVDVLVAFINR